jgi:hypothetical protein
MKTPVIKVRENLFIQDSSIISYNTHVASIEENRIIQFGKFTRTTGKQISAIASMLKMRIQSNDERVGFFKLEFGAKCDPGNCLSNKASKLAMEQMTLGKSFLQAMCIILKESIKQDDRELIHSYLQGNLGDSFLKVASAMQKEVSW